MWNVEIHIPIPIPEFWNVECGIVGIPIPHSKILECELECGIPHSIFHIPMHFSMVGMRYSQKAIPHSTFQNSGMGIGMWIFHIPNSKPLEFELESELGIHLHSKFHSIPIPLWLSQTYLQCCSILSSIPIPQWMEWNVESRFDTGCCLELLFARGSRSWNHCSNHAAFAELCRT